jgi:hypothetical protein
MLQDYLMFTSLQHCLHKFWYQCLIRKVSVSRFKNIEHLFMVRVLRLNHLGSATGYRLFGGINLNLKRFEYSHIKEYNVYKYLKGLKLYLSFLKIVPMKLEPSLVCYCDCLRLGTVHDRK